MNFKYRYALLDNGTIEPLYYNGNQKRTFYKKRNKWYLDHLVKNGDGFVTKHSKIVNFLTKEDIKK